MIDLAMVRKKHTSIYSVQRAKNAFTEQFDKCYSELVELLTVSPVEVRCAEYAEAYELRSENLNRSEAPAL